MGIITLLTDFGTRDPYVGIMKGVILSIHPDAEIIDITHNVEAQDIREAAFMLRDYWHFFPSGTVHLAIVDPTVGSLRRPVIMKSAGHFFVGPDNGLFSFVANSDSQIHTLENRAYMLPGISATFHGRDIFSPAAAWVSKGIDPEILGRQITDPVILHDIHPVIAGNTMTGTIVRFDHFGNAISNITIDMLRSFAKDSSFHITIGNISFDSLAASYYEDKYTCLAGSSGYIEFGVFGGSFREEKRVTKDDRVVVTIP
ncbi:MAG: SAM hydrolase/SAM-dependent halogenase family protein [Syntrophorhabdaceae bacterium]